MESFILTLPIEVFFNEQKFDYFILENKIKAQLEAVAQHHEYDHVLTMLHEETEYWEYQDMVVCVYGFEEVQSLTEDGVLVWQE